MAADRSYIAENDRERRRLEALVGKLDDATLSRPMPDGWTVAGVLAHLAFSDQPIVTSSFSSATRKVRQPSFVTRPRSAP